MPLPSVGLNRTIHAIPSFTMNIWFLYTNENSQSMFQGTCWSLCISHSLGSPSGKPSNYWCREVGQKSISKSLSHLEGLPTSLPRSEQSKEMKATQRCLTSEGI